MKILVACEESQAVCKAFRKLGYEAYSADIQDCSGGHPEWHVKQDVLPLIRGGCTFLTCDSVEHTVEKWDLIIAHPPCTYITNAGACRMYPHKGQIDEARFAKAMEAKEFFLQFYNNTNCKHIAIENPVPMRIIGLPEKTQAIQPYEYGHPYTKKTYLWLKGLPTLSPTNVVKPLGPYVCGNSDIWKKQAAKGVVYGKEKSAKYRSKTFPGIADAMAEQWSKYIENEEKTNDTEAD